MVRSLGKYSLRPVVLCTDDADPNITALYSRFIGSTENKDAGWRYNTTTSKWEKVGDLAVTFEQET